MRKIRNEASSCLGIFFRTLHFYYVVGSPRGVLLCFIDPRVRKIRNEASSCPGIFSRTLHFYYVASSPVLPLEMQIEILNGWEILVNCKFKLNKNLEMNLYRKI